MTHTTPIETKGASDLGFAFDDLLRAFEAFKDTNDAASTTSSGASRPTC